MRELGILISVIVGMLLLRSLYSFPWDALFYGGIWVTAIGVLFGLPTGFIYHVRLYQALKPIAELPSNWYWRPIALNHRVPDDKRTEVLAWCYAGAVGFVIICLGLLLMAVGAIIAIFRGV